MQKNQIDPWVRKIPWRREWQPTTLFFPGEFDGYSPWGHKELDMTKQLTHSYDVWNTLTVDGALYKSMDGSFGRSIVCREDKSITRVRIYSSKNKTLLIPYWM